MPCPGSSCRRAQAAVIYRRRHRRTCPIKLLLARSMDSPRAAAEDLSGRLVDNTGAGAHRSRIERLAWCPCRASGAMA